MKKYLTIFYIFLKQYFAYRLSFILWRLRNILGLVFLYFLWTSVSHQKSEIFSYTTDNLISYILLVNILSSIILTTRTADIANEIRTGYFVNYLLKPFSFFKFILTKEIVDKLINCLFAIFEIVILITIFKPKIFIQTNLVTYFIFFLTVTAATIIYFYISLTLSFIAFWSSQIWAPRFIFLILISLLAGTIFPLDILPRAIFNLLLVTPLPYLIFFPAKIYLQGFSNQQVIPFFISIFWSLILFKTMVYIWKKGIKNYTAYGK